MIDSVLAFVGVIVLISGAVIAATLAIGAAWIMFRAIKEEWFL